MQDFLQSLQNAREIVASGPVVLQAVHDQLIAEGTTPLQALMLLRNLNFRVTRNPPDQRRNNGRAASFSFEAYRPLRTKSNYV